MRRGFDGHASRTQFMVFKESGQFKKPSAISRPSQSQHLHLEVVENSARSFADEIELA